jgi:hypothetical protein
MELRRVVRWLAFLVVVLAFSLPVLRPRPFSWGPTLAIAGLLLDILGAITVTWSVMKLHAAELERRSASPFPSRTVRWWRDFPTALARWLGAPKLMATAPTEIAAGDLEDAFIGLLMFAGGFVGQAAAVVIVWIGTR